MTVTVEMIRTAMNHGYLVVQDEQEQFDAQFMIYKIPTRINGEMSASKLLFQKFSTFEEAFQVIINTIDPPEMEWTAIMRYDQGMGPQMKTLEPFKAKDMASAKEIGKEIANAYLQSKPDLRKAKLMEVRVNTSGKS